MMKKLTLWTRTCGNNEKAEAVDEDMREAIVHVAFGEDGRPPEASAILVQLLLDDGVWTRRNRD